MEIIGGLRNWWDIIDECNEIHNWKYDYSEYEYKNIDFKSTIICPKHGRFQQSMYKHATRKQGCPGVGCSKRPRINTESFKIIAKEIHGDRYNYDKVKYMNQHTKVIIGCHKHGDFLQSPVNHTIKAKGCSKCNGGVKLSREDVLIKANEVHNFRYTYEDFVLVNYHTPSWITCKEHGNFKQHFNNHINSGKGCPMCQNKTEGILMKLLKENFNYKIIHNRGFDWCRKNKKLRYDFIIEDLKCIIELDGRQHFKQVSNWDSPEDQLENDTFKNDKALENGYSMIRVFQPDIFNNKPDIILKLISSIQYYREPRLICIGKIYESRF